MLQFKIAGDSVSDISNSYSGHTHNNERAGALSAPTGQADFVEIAAPPRTEAILTAQTLQSGPFMPPVTRVLTYSSGEWESLVQEWAFYSLKPKYLRCERFSGANDKGIDIAGFADPQLLNGVWDNYQCKHYDHPLQPTDVWIELGKVIWHSFDGAYLPPRFYYFVASRGIGPKLTHFLSNIRLLKDELAAAWEKHCQNEITATQTIELKGDFADYFDRFDFSIFTSISLIELLDQHRSSPCHLQRFGGGLPARPLPGAVPDSIAADESIYVQKLIDAYSEHTGAVIGTPDELSNWAPLRDHFIRQREAFYHAESLRVFVRDKVEPGTFESLQEEFHRGVVDICDEDFSDGYRRVLAVTRAAQELHISSHPLSIAVFVRDRHGVCHQLANDDRLKWTKP